MEKKEIVKEVHNENTSDDDKIYNGRNGRKTDGKIKLVK